MFWKLHFAVLSNFKIKISSNAPTKLRSENVWKLRTAIIINRPVRLQIIICHKKRASLSLSSTYKTRADTQGLRKGGSGGTSFPDLGGHGRVQVSALSFGVARSGVCMGLNFSEDLFFGLPLILDKKSD